MPKTTLELMNSCPEMAKERGKKIGARLYQLVYGGLWRERNDRCSKDQGITED